MNSGKIVNDYLSCDFALYFSGVTTFTPRQNSLQEPEILWFVMLFTQE
jgi:hypothetical protein